MTHQKALNFRAYTTSIRESDLNTFSFSISVIDGIKSDVRLIRVIA